MMADPGFWISLDPTGTCQLLVHIEGSRVSRSSIRRSGGHEARSGPSRAGNPGNPGQRAPFFPYEHLRRRHSEPEHRRPHQVLAREVLRLRAGRQRPDQARSGPAAGIPAREPVPVGKTSGACPGYLVDHIKPLRRGGADEPGNMQWQTVEEAKAKDRWED